MRLSVVPCPKQKQESFAKIAATYVAFIWRLMQSPEYSAVIATCIRPPAERSLLNHIQYIRELLDMKVLGGIIWQDTRDMVAYALTKGSVERDLIHAVMSGMQLVRHDFEMWSPRV